MKISKINIPYIYRKIANALRVRISNSKRVAPNFFLLNPNEIIIKKVLFYFPDPKFMHLGDHLFFEPVCRLFKENGIEVHVSVVKSMQNYFTGLGYKASDPSLASYDLIVTRRDFIHLLKQYKNILSVNIAYAAIKKPLIEDMQEKFSKMLNLKRQVSSAPLYLHANEAYIYEKLKIDKYNKYVVYNNYVISGNFRIKKGKFNKLSAFARQFKLRYPEIKFIHTGSQADKDREPDSPAFIDIDLRGKTTVDDLFVLCHQDCVVNYIGFDGFIMHLFFMLKKKAFVMSRGRWSKKSRFFLENFIDPPFTPDVSVKNIKEYIE